MENTNLDPEVENTLRKFRTLTPAQKAQFNLAEVNEVELPPELAQPIEAAGEMPELPESARVPAELGAGACPWLDRYIEYSRIWSPRAYNPFHEAAGLFVLSTVAARRVMVNFGRPRYPSLYLGMVGRSSMFAKTTTADIGIDLLTRAGLAYLLAADNATPQSFIAKMTPRVPEDYDQRTTEEQELARLRLSFAGKRGWFYEEFGQHVRAMMHEGGFMADFRGLLRRFDDGADRYEYSTVGRGDDIIRQPYLALFANMTPADLKPFAKRGAGLWGDGFLARFALITPPEGERSRAQFPEGERVPPAELLTSLVDWHKRLGVPTSEIVTTSGAGDGQPTTKRLESSAYPLTVLDLPKEIHQAYYSYHDGLLDLTSTNNNQDLDGNYARFAEKALRVAVLLASVSGSERVDMTHWARAQAITERWRAGLHELYRQLNAPEPTEDQEKEERVIDVIRQKHNPTVREIAQTIRLSAGEIGLIIRRLVDAGILEEIPTQTGRTSRYVLVP